MNAAVVAAAGDAVDAPAFVAQAAGHDYDAVPAHTAAGGPAQAAKVGVVLSPAIGMCAVAPNYGPMTAAGMVAAVVAAAAAVLEPQAAHQKQVHSALVHGWEWPFRNCWLISETMAPTTPFRIVPRQLPLLHSIAFVHMAVQLVGLVADESA